MKNIIHTRSIIIDFFFFQAEDGIRDRNVTGVQTCALPISGSCAGPGTVTSAGFNLESTNSCALNNTGDLVNTEPGLGPVQDNGGPTPTQALPAGSPAVDARSEERRVGKECGAAGTQAHANE